MYPSLSSYMIEWMTYCTEYQSALEEANKQGVYDLSHYLYYEEKRMDESEVRYLKALKEALGLKEEDDVHDV